MERALNYRQVRQKYRLMTTKRILTINLAVLCALSFTGLSPANALGLKKPAANTESEPEKMDIRDKWALVVGINKFADPAITGQRLAQKSASDVARALKDADSGHFGLDHVLSVNGADASKAGIEQAFNEWLFKKALPDDLVVIYMNSKLVKNAAGEIFLCANDSKLAEPEKTAINLLDFLKNVRQRIGSTHILCLLDTNAALSSDANKSIHDLKWLASNSGVTVLAASDLLKPSGDDQTSLQTYFVHYFVEALKTGGGNFPLAMTAEYVWQKVQEATQQSGAQSPVLALPTENSQTVSIPIGMMVKSSLPHQVAIGHPLDNLGMSRPDIVAPTNTATKPGIKLQARNPVPSKVAKPVVRSAAEDEDDEDFDPKLDLRPYVTKMKADIQKRWVTPKGLESKRVTTMFSITREGKIVNPEIVESSGSEEVDKSALAALVANVDPLPKGSPRTVDIKYVFDWTSKPVTGSNSPATPTAAK